MKTPATVLTLTTSLLLAFSAHAADKKPTSISEEIRQEMADARLEVRAEMAQARRELETGNLDISNSLQFGGKSGKRETLPQAEISPAGDFLIEGERQAITTSQRRQLLAYRGLVIELAKAGIDIGERSANAALDAVGNGSLVGMMFGAFTGGLERRIERLVREEVEPAVRGLCRQLPKVLESQQQLATSLPRFRPYATLESGDVRDCERDVRHEFASL